MYLMVCMHNQLNCSVLSLIISNCFEPFPLKYAHNHQILQKAASQDKEKLPKSNKFQLIYDTHQSASVNVIPFIIEMLVPVQFMHVNVCGFHLLVQLCETIFSNFVEDTVII